MSVIVINRNFEWMLIIFLIFTGIALGGYDDLSVSTEAENLTAANPTVQSLETDTGSALADAMAPQVPASEPGSQTALYVSQNPINADLKGLMPFNAEVSPSTNVFYKGNYLGWNGFTSQFPGTSAGLWIERSAGWSLYATMPLNGWARELLYVPITTPIFMYDIYPSGFVMRYNMGVVQPGYYYLWYYADTPGRHFEVFGISSGYSNKVVIDVYPISVPMPVPPKPVPPDPRKECEKKPTCHWSDSYQQCYCTGFKPENPEKQSCEQKSYCSWVDGQCLCTMPNPEPIPGPAPNPVAECEKNAGCFWADGQCQCSPGPVPNPNPIEPIEPVPNPTPDDSQGGSV